MLALIEQARVVIPQPLRSATYQTLIGLLATTGLRVGEAIRLERGQGRRLAGKCARRIFRARASASRDQASALILVRHHWGGRRPAFANEILSRAQLLSRLRVAALFFAGAHGRTGNRGNDTDRRRDDRRTGDDQEECRGAGAQIGDGEPADSGRDQ